MATIHYSATAAFNWGEQVTLTGSEGTLIIQNDDRLFGAREREHALRPDRLVGRPPHQHRVALRRRPEVLEVLGDAPRDVAPETDHPVAGDGRDHHDPLGGRRTRIRLLGRTRLVEPVETTHTAMGALIPGCGS